MFVSLAETLRASREPSRPDDAAAVPPPAREPAASHELRAAVREAKLFRARLLDAFEAALPRLLADLAADVLVRELRVAPCDLAALAARAARRAPILRLRVAPEDLGLDAGIPVAADPELEPGDAVFELCNGALDARLGVRLRDVLEAQR